MVYCLAMRFQPKNGVRRKTCVEECANLDIRWIFPHGAPRPRCVCVGVQVYYVVAGQPHTPTVKLTATRTFVRRTLQPWFLCPSCGRRCGRLYLPAGEVALKCRRCWGLQYASQLWPGRRAREYMTRARPGDPPRSPIAPHTYVWEDTPRPARPPLVPWLGRRRYD
jgi:hypothetical protein